MNSPTGSTRPSSPGTTSPATNYLTASVLRLNDDREILAMEIADAHRDGRRGEPVVLLTDLPRRAGTQPIASDFSTEGKVALVPALGAIRLW